MPQTVASAYFRTAFVRALGFLSAYVAWGFILARQFGKNEETDALFIALTLPNIIAGVSAAILPQSFLSIFSDYRVRSSAREAWSFATAAFLRLGLVYLVLVMVGWLAAPFIVRLLGPKLSPPAAEQAVHYLRWLMPLILFSALSGILKAILNSFRHFALPAAESLMMNFCFITLVLLAGSTWGIQSVVWGITLGYFAFMLLQLFYVLPHWERQSFSLRPHPGISQWNSVLLPALAMQMAPVLVYFLGRSMASALGEGAVSALGYAEKIAFPLHELLVLTVMTALLPTSTEYVAAGRTADFTRSTMLAVKASFLFACPIALLLALQAEPLVRLIYERGHFQASDTAETAKVLFAFLLALPANTYVIVIYAFYAMKLTKRLFIITLFLSAVNVALFFLLTPSLGVQGIAAAFAFTAWLDLGVYLLLFKRTQRSADLGDFFRFALKVILAAAVSGAMVWFSDQQGMLIEAKTSLLLSLRLFLVLLLGGGIYLLALWLLRTPELALFKSKVQELFQKGASPLH